MTETMYCPCCFKPLDASGDCWPICNYESKNCAPEYAPLNRKQVLKRLLITTNSHIVSAKLRVQRLENEAAGYEQQLELCGLVIPHPVVANMAEHNMLPIAAWRAYRGWSQRGLGDRMGGLTESQVAEIESLNLVEAGTLERAAKALGVDVEQLLL